MENISNSILFIETTRSKAWIIWLSSLGYKTNVYAFYTICFNQQNNKNNNNNIWKERRKNYAGWKFPYL